MRDLREYRSRINSQQDRVVVQVGEECLVEKNGGYLIRGFNKIGQAKVTFYRGIDEDNDPLEFVEAYTEGR